MTADLWAQWVNGAAFEPLMPLPEIACTVIACTSRLVLNASNKAQTCVLALWPSCAAKRIAMRSRTSDDDNMAVWSMQIMTWEVPTPPTSGHGLLETFHMRWTRPKSVRISHGFVDGSCPPYISDIILEREHFRVLEYDVAFCSHLHRHLLRQDHPCNMSESADVVQSWLDWQWVGPKGVLIFVFGLLLVLISDSSD